MKENIKQTIKGMVVAAVLLLAALTVTNAKADAQVGDFYVTNAINPLVALVSPPTNAPGTVNSNTGYYVSAANYTELGVKVTGTSISTNTTDVISVTLCRAGVSGAPVGGDFEAGSWNFRVPIASGTNAIVFYTNAPTLWMRPATHIGIASVTNIVVGTGATFTGVSIKPVLKIVPLTYP